MAYRYKNPTDQKFFIPGVGDVEPNSEFDSPVKINNNTFHEIDAESPQTPTLSGNEAQTDTLTHESKSVKVDRVGEDKA